MPSTFKIGKCTALVCFVAVFGLGIAAERYRQYLATNVGDLSVQRTSPEIDLTIDGDTFIGWELPVTLRAGSHQFHATWQEYHVDTTITVKRGDKVPLDRVKYSLDRGQLRVEHNRDLIDVVPRPASEVFAIQTASGEFWHTTESGDVVLRSHNEVGDAEMYTAHWLRPDHTEAFIQSSNGRFLTGSSGILTCSDRNDWPSVFRIDRVEANDSWRRIATGQRFVDVEADPNRVRTTSYEVFASTHLLKAAGDSVAMAPAPPMRAVPVASANSVRRFNGHTDVIRAIVFTPDGKHIISGSADATIRFWDLQSGKQVDTIRTHRPVMGLAISSDGKTLAGGMAGSVVKIWKLEHDPVIAHRDERVLARGNHRVAQPSHFSPGVLSIAFSPDNTRVAAGHRIWNLLAPAERCKSINGVVTSLLWARSGDRILLYQENGRKLRWWPKSELKTPRVHGPRPLLVQSGVDPLVISGGDVVNAETLQLVHSVKQRSDVRTVSAQLSASRKLLVTGNMISTGSKLEAKPDELVSVWDLRTGRQLAVLRDHVGQVGNIAISTNGEHVAYGNGIYDTHRIYTKKSTGDYDLRVWQIP